MPGKGTMAVSKSPTWNREAKNSQPAVAAVFPTRCREGGSDVPQAGSEGWRAHRVTCPECTGHVWVQTKGDVRGFSLTHISDEEHELRIGHYPSVGASLRLDAQFGVIVDGGITPPR